MQLQQEENCCGHLLYSSAEDGDDDKSWKGGKEGVWGAGLTVLMTL